MVDKVFKVYLQRSQVDFTVGYTDSDDRQPVIQNVLDRIVSEPMGSLSGATKESLVTLVRNELIDDDFWLSKNVIDEDDNKTTYLSLGTK